MRKNINKTIKELIDLLSEFGYFLPANFEERYTKICNEYLQDLRLSRTKIGYNHVGEQYMEYYMFELLLIEIEMWSYSIHSIKLDIINEIKYMIARRDNKILYDSREDSPEMQKLYEEAKLALNGE